MILAAHQPQYLAWLGYYHKMARCDVFVYLDEVQFKKHEFQNRNRIKTPTGVQWLTAPAVTRGRYDQKVREVELDPTQDWRSAHLKALGFNYARAPHFAEHEPFLRSVYGRAWTRLADICLEMDAYLRSQSGAGCRVLRESELGSEGASTKRLISICRRAGADAYLSGQGGKGYLDEAAFADAGIRLVYQEFHHPEYPQIFGPLASHLAAVDLLFNCGSEGLRRACA